MLHNLRSLLAHPDVIRSIRAAYLVSDLGNGGQERQLYNLVTTFKSEGFKLVVPWHFNLDDKYLSLLKEIDSVIVLNLTDEHGILAKVGVLRVVLKLTNADFLHSYSFHLNFAAWLCTLFLKPKAIGGIRSRLVLNRKSSGIFRFYLSLLFPFHRISNNYSCFKDLDKPTLFFSKVLTRTKFVHNGIDTDIFKPLFDARNWKVEEFRTVSVGRLYPMKKIEHIIDWVHNMRLLGYNIYHLHAGEGPEMVHLGQKINDLGIQNYFKFLGNVSDIPRLFAGSDLFVHAAQHEGCPNVIMEAMSCGLAILSSDAGDTSHIVDHGENGYVFKIGDTKSMLDYGIKFAENRALLESFGNSGAEKAQKKFSVFTYVENLSVAYREIGVKI